MFSEEYICDNNCEERIRTRETGCDWHANLSVRPKIAAPTPATMKYSTAVQLNSGLYKNARTLRIATCTKAITNVAVTGVLSFMPLFIITALRPKLKAAMRAYNSYLIVDAVNTDVDIN